MTAVESTAADDTSGVLPAAIADWKGTDRYEVRRCIGAGAMGTVYEAFDREGGQMVALKRLRHFTPAALYLFKQEFRTLVDVHHPNLVRLYELVATEDHDVFFTMELVHGVDLIQYVEQRGAAKFDRLRAVLCQLVEGAQALHAAGKLHRDIKPSNVLVTPEGRVVLLDFGVATEFAGVAAQDLREEHPIVGTASYMAPEQASNVSPTPASDWYSVGAVLFEALVGRAPFVGSVLEVIRLKGMADAPAPAECADGVPADLDALCRALLRRAPDARPSGPEILRRLGGVRRTPLTSPVPPADLNGAPKLVGRGDHLRALREAFEVARGGRCVTVRVSGPSGMGKSVLVQDFVDDLVRHGEAVVLRGRAYERESVPYKAIDSWVDAMSRHLLRLSDRGAQVALPRDAWALARLFPVLRRVPEIADLREETVIDPHRIRRRAFVALRELLGALSQVQPVVVCVDDVHWGDTDSAALILDLVRPPDAPPLLLVMTYREEEAQRSGFLIETRTHWPEAAEARDLAVGPLDAADAVQLALALLGSDDERSQATALDVAREAHGDPCLVEELVRSHQGATDGGPSSMRRLARVAVEGVTPLTLEQSVQERLEQLPDGPRRLLEMVAVSGRPLRVSMVPGASGAGPVDDALELLRSRRFVRAGMRSGHEVVEISHDRVRDAIVSKLSGDLVRGHHLGFAALLESTPSADPEAVAVHLIGAGEKERAAPYALRAAEEAITKLAFDRAAQLFRLALEGTPPSSPEARSLSVRLAEAIGWAGRGAEAARVFLDAAGKAPGLERVALERAAAEQLLASGRIDEGADVLRRVLSAIGVRAPRSPLSALFWLAMYRLWLGVIGLRFKEREPGDVRQEDRVRIDAMYAVAIGFAVVDVLLAACMQARHLILALRKGDRYQVLRAASLEVSQLAGVGGREGKRERALVEVARRLAAGTGNLEAEAFHEGSLGVSLFLRGRWKEARNTLAGSATKLSHGHAHWQSNGHLFSVRSHYFSGEIKELARRQGPLYSEAQDRGDLYTTVNFDTTTTITAHLAADDPEGARNRVRQGMAQWSQTGFFVQQWQAMAFEPDIDLYVGDGAAAYDRLKRDLSALRRSLLLNVQFIRGITLYARGRCAVASVDARPGRRRARIAEARRMARRLERERMTWTAPLAAMVKAAVENADGDRAGAVLTLRAAIQHAEAANMSMHATAARHRLGELLGGEEGRLLATTAVETMVQQGIRNPERWLAIYLPGSWRAGQK